MVTSPSNIKKFLFGTDWQIDQVIGTFTGSFSSSAPTFASISTTDSTVITTSISDKTFFQGIFSTDGGVTWLDFNSQKADLSTPSTPVFQTCRVFGKSISNQLTLYAQNFYDFVHSTGTAYTVLYKVALICPPTQANTTPLAAGSKFLINTDLNYGKIALDTYQDFTIGAFSANTFTFTHSLGYVPRIRSFIDTPDYFSYGTGMYDTGFLTASDAYQGIKIDSSGVYVTIDNSSNSLSVSGRLFMRVYYDI